MHSIQQSIQFYIHISWAGSLPDWLQSQLVRDLDWSQSVSQSAAAAGWLCAYVHACLEKKVKKSDEPLPADPFGAGAEKK